MFCEEQYDCEKPVLCAVANALNKRVTSATSILEKVGLDADDMATICLILAEYPDDWREYRTIVDSRIFPCGYNARPMANGGS